MTEKQFFLLKNETYFFGCCFGEYIDYGIGSTRRIIRVWKDVFDNVKNLRGFWIGEHKPIIRGNYPHSCSINRKGWKKEQRKRKQKNKNSNKT